MVKYPRLFFFAVIGLCLAPAVASAQQYIGTGAGLYTDDGDLTGERRVDLQEDDESFSYEAHNTLSGGIWYLRHASENIRWGGGLRYYGSFEVLEIPEEEDSDDEIQPYELGQLTDFYLQAEYLVPFGGNKAFIIGAQIGPSLLMPDGEFQREIDALKDEGVGVWDSPRIGYNIAPQIGGKWEFDDRLAVRADLGMRYESLYLFAVDDNVDGVSYKRDWTTSTLRYEFGLAMEIRL